MIEVNISTQVAEFCRNLPPVPRRKLRSVLRRLREERGEIKQLEGRLSGYCRLRSGAYRVVFAYRTVRGKRRIACLYAGYRSIVYTLLGSQESVREFLKGGK